MKLTILTPVYNDAAHVGEFIESVLAQTYSDWELVIVNDGSNDETPALLDAFAERDSRIRVRHQENAGQQEALLNALPMITGDVVLLAHSDDSLHNPGVLEHNMAYFANDYQLDGLYGDFYQIDGDSNPSGVLHYPNHINQSTVKNLLRDRGSNPIPDHFFCRRRLVESHVKQNYLYWNMPYWLSGSEQRNIRPLRLKKTAVPWYNYRVYGGNYHTSDTGKFVMSHGCMRTVLALAAQYRLVRLFKWQRRPFVWPLAANAHQRHRLLQKTLQDYYGKHYGNKEQPYHVYHKALLRFYEPLENKHQPERILLWPAHWHGDAILAEFSQQQYYGKDAVAFFKQAPEAWPALHQWLLEEAQKGGFSRLTGVPQPFQTLASTALRFLNLSAAIVA